MMTILQSVCYGTLMVLVDHSSPSYRHRMEMIIAVPEWLIKHYRDKNILEQDYHILKSPDIIRNRPIRHWTDTKIRAFCFSCVCALLIARIMEMKVEKNYRRMSIGLIKEELQDLKLITMIYEKNDLEVKVTDRSTVQQKLFDIFNLKEIEKNLTIQTCFKID